MTNMTDMTNFITAALGLLALAACDRQPPEMQPEDQAAVTAPPPEICAQAKQGLDKLSETGGFEFTQQGEAIIPDEIWLQMAPAQRDQLTQLLGFNAACNAPQPVAEQNVRVRNEFGRVLVEQVVETSVDFSKILEE